MLPALAYVGKTLASVKKTSGGEPAAKPCVSCWLMSEAATTSTLLPVLVSHALTVSCWSLTSAGPFEVIMNLIVTGPLAGGCVAPLPPPLSKPPPPPHAASASTPVRQAATAAVVVLRDIGVSCFGCGVGQRHVPRGSGAHAGWVVVGPRLLGGGSGVGTRRGGRLAHARGAHGQGGLEQHRAGRRRGVDEHVPGGAGGLGDGLVDARQLHGGGHVGVVEADDPHVAPGLEAAVAHGAQDAEGEQVGGADHGRVGSEPVEQARGGVGGLVEVLDRLRGRSIARDAELGEAVGPALPAVVTDG